MIKKNFILYGVFFGLIGLIIFLYYPAIKDFGSDVNMQPDNQNEMSDQLDSASQNMVQIAISEIAKKTTINNVSDIKIIEVQEKEFPDGSLGCPQEGMAYTQAVESGYIVKLEYEGAIYDYRIGQNNRILQCE
jgi:hypothetical protein